MTESQGIISTNCLLPGGARSQPPGLTLQLLWQSWEVSCADEPREVGSDVGFTLGRSGYRSGHCSGRDGRGAVGVPWNVFPHRARPLGTETQNSSEGCALPSDSACKALWGVLAPFARQGRWFWRGQRAPETKSQHLENV